MLLLGRSMRGTQEERLGSGWDLNGLNVWNAPQPTQKDLTQPSVCGRTAPAPVRGRGAIAVVFLSARHRHLKMPAFASLAMRSTVYATCLQEFLSDVLCALSCFLID